MCPIKAGMAVIKISLILQQTFHNSSPRIWFNLRLRARARASTQLQTMRHPLKLRAQKRCLIMAHL